MNPFLWFKNPENIVGAGYSNSSDIQTRSRNLNKIRTNSLLMIVAVNGVVWGAALFYLITAKKTYVSDWSINIPISNTNANINLPNIGQATSQDSSAYSGTTFDPRENYKAVANSEEVLKLAARDANMPLKKYGKPRIKIVNNTTFIEFELKGSTPQEAQQKSTALYNALETKLNQLRQEEISQQNRLLQTGIDELREKLKASQERLSMYKVASGLSSDEQLSNLAINIETLRRQRAELIAQEQESQAGLVELSANLGLSSQEASYAFILQGDTLFQKYLQSYNEAKSQLITLSAKFLFNHPIVVTQKAELRSAETSLISRARLLLKRPVSMAAINKINFGNTDASGAKRTDLSEKLVTASVETRGLQAQVKTLDKEITALEARLKMLSQRQSVIEDLKRDVQVYEAVFSSTIARLDLTKARVSASYPQIQVMSKPSLPENPTAPKKEFVVLGALLGSVLLTGGMVRVSQQHTFKEENSKSLKRSDAMN
ncbi:hypothetical protein WA1_31380 [Scytonema hofmannii PCC 7110]|uniref:Chain-length determining protein n=1 Tax=Scytonema hofmannii PCC 7110 TaxID=128403 RepID=A0A139X3K9_9CYAN|nr:hypothetical protein [Scytonema hofmannii]KYC39246.1 hypothetical protein WA1_31380 [Scytonema hofmannii PCC 7110]